MVRNKKPKNQYDNKEIQHGSLSNSHEYAAVAEPNANIYWEKALSHQQKVADVANMGFLWHPDTLFQSNEILVRSSLSCTKYC